MKRNFLKKLSVIATSIGLTLCMSSSILALPEARLPRCTRCGTGVLITTNTSTDWGPESQQFCSHYPFGVDIIYSRTIISTTSCNFCGIKADHSVRTENKIECKGFYK